MSIRPEEARELQEEIDGYLRCMSISESMFDENPTRFEVRLLKVLSERDADFFEMLANLCKMGTNQWHWSQKDESEIRHIAVQSKRWLEANHKPVNRDAIR